MIRAARIFFVFLSTVLADAPKGDAAAALRILGVPGFDSIDL